MKLFSFHPKVLSNAQGPFGMKLLHFNRVHSYLYTQPHTLCFRSNPHAKVKFRSDMRGTQTLYDY